MMCSPPPQLPLFLYVSHPPTPILYVLPPPSPFGFLPQKIFKQNRTRQEARGLGLGTRGQGLLGVMVNVSYFFPGKVYLSLIHKMSDNFVFFQFQEKNTDLFYMKSRQATHLPKKWISPKKGKRKIKKAMFNILEVFFFFLFKGFFSWRSLRFPHTIIFRGRKKKALEKKHHFYSLILFLPKNSQK